MFNILDLPVLSQRTITPPPTGWTIGLTLTLKLCYSNSNSKSFSGSPHKRLPGVWLKIHQKCWKVIKMWKNVACFKINENLFFTKIMLWRVFFWYCHNLIKSPLADGPGVTFVLRYDWEKIEFPFQQLDSHKNNSLPSTQYSIMGC